MDRAQLLDDLVTAFNEAEIDDLCFRLGVNGDSLAAEGRREKARVLIGYMGRRGRLKELVALIVEERPHLKPAYTAVLNPTATPRPPTIKLPPRPSTAPLPKPNPYNAGPMVRDEEMFFGRQTERRHMRVRLQNMGCSAIVGLRRIGKSSLLYYLSHHELMPQHDGFLFAFLDLQDSQYDTLAGVLNGAWQQWYHQIQEGAAPAVRGLVDFSSHVRALRTNGYRPVLCLDEFENLTKHPQEFTDDVYENWRALANAGQMAFLTTSQRPLADLIKNEGLTSNFYNIFHQVNLGVLTAEAARALLTEPMAARGIEILPETIEAWLALCGYHPYYLQMAAFYHVDAFMAYTYEWHKVRDQFVWAAEPSWRDLWQDLTLPEQLTLLSLLSLNGNPGTDRQYRILRQKGIIRREADGHHHLFSEGFAAWLTSLSDDELLALMPGHPPPPTAVKSRQNLLDWWRNLRQKR